MEDDSWDEVEEMARRHEESGSLWLKLANDKDRAVVVFLGKPYGRTVCFVDGKYLLFDDNLKAQGAKPQLRLAFNVALYDSKEVKVLEQGPAFLKDLKRVRDKFNPKHWAFEIQRHGAARAVTTKYTILPEHQLTAEQQATFQALVRHDLPALYAGETGGDELDSYDRGAGAAKPKQPGAGAQAVTTAVVEERMAQLLVTHLKALPRAATERFCSTFGIARIKELPAAETAKALMVLDKLVAEYDPPPSASAPPDPFE